MRGSEGGCWEDVVQDAVRGAGVDERLTVAGAAERLGITKEAVRKRIHRSTLRSDRDTDGTVWVCIPPSDTPSSSERELLYEELRDRIAYLERQVEEEREARRRADTLLARLMDRVPELEAPQGPSRETRGSPERIAEGEGRDDAPQEWDRPAERRQSWWREYFGFGS